MPRGRPKKKPIEPIAKAPTLDEQKTLLELVEARAGLPHLFGLKHYRWSREFVESRNRYNFLVGGNQISKSSSMIRKAVYWATEQRLWPHLWETRPNQFWYLYPNRDTATAEWRHKWMAEWMPRGKYRQDPQFGFVDEIKNRHIHAVHFATGVSIYFKTYAQSVMDLQSGTVHAVFCDEECPEEYFDELNMRLAATSGYFHMAFTATKGQEIWRATMEETGDFEKFKGAFKKRVSLYDCLQYEDETPSHWTEDRIRQIEASCKSQAEVDKRVHGRFVLDTGLMYPQFQRSKHLIADAPIPKDWPIFAGVDIGGGGKGHPAAIIFLAVSPDYQKARVFKLWRGDGIITTASDILTQYQIMKGDLNITCAYFDFASKDFGTIAARVGELFVPAEKNRDVGTQIVGTLFKNDMLLIHSVDGAEKLANELTTLTYNRPKTVARDDLCFTAGTMVRTPSGERPIESLEFGDLVETRFGARPIIGLMNRPSVETISARFSNGVVVQCTANHPFWTASGFKNCSLLTDTDTLLTYEEWQNQKSLSLKELNLEDIQTQRFRPTNDISVPASAGGLRVFRAFIKKFGNQHTEKFLRGITSTTKMVITSTINCLIWSVFQPFSILVSTCEKRLRKIRSHLNAGLSTQDHLLVNGINQRPVESGIAKIVSEHGRSEKNFRNNVLFVRNLIGQRTQERLQDFAAVPVRPGNGGLGTVLKDIRSCGNARVFNITVEYAHEYFANGLLVSNCDALRYSLSKLPWDWSIVQIKKDVPKSVQKSEAQLRMDNARQNQSFDIYDIEQDMQMWDELLGVDEYGSG